MSQGLKNGDHLQLEGPVEDGLVPVSVHRNDGSFTTGIAEVVKGGSGGSVTIEPCNDQRASGSGIYHVKKMGHPGPARVTNAAFCEGYEKTFVRRKVAQA